MSKIRVALVDNLTGNNVEHAKRQKALLTKRLSEGGLSERAYEIVTINADVNHDGTVRPDEVRYTLDKLDTHGSFDYVNIYIGFKDSDFIDDIQKQSFFKSVETVDDNDTEVWVPAGNKGIVNEVAKVSGVTVVGANTSNVRNKFTSTSYYSSTAEKILKENPNNLPTGSLTCELLSYALGTRILKDMGQFSSTTNPSPSTTLAGKNNGGFSNWLTSFFT